MKALFAQDAANTASIPSVRLCPAFRFAPGSITKKFVDIDQTFHKLLIQHFVRCSVPTLI